MTYLELYEDALRKLHNSLITVGEFEMMVKPLNREVEAEPKTGEWKVKREHNRWMRKCSVCGWMQEIDTPKMQGWVYRYCPNCGSLMDKDGEDE